MAVRVKCEETVGRAAGILDHQPGGIAVAHEEFEVDLVGPQQFVDQR
jgi:hypothetical protein